MTKLFIIYKANIHAINKNNQMPIDKVPENMVVDFKNLFEKFDSLYKISKSIYDKPVKATFPSISKDSKCLIACDGGGMRYLVVLQVLKAIEDRMMELDPSSCNPSIGSHFDYIAGTSSGSLFPVAHTYNNFALSQMLLTYLNMAQKVCTKQKSFGETISNFLLEDLVDTSLVMSDVQQPRVIITTTLAECVPPILHLLTNYGEARDGQKGPNERKVCQAMAMSASAPTHIEPFEGKFIDGGMIANNPTLDALADLILQEKKEGNNEIKLGVVVSIGTGSGPIQPIGNISVSKPHSLVGTIDFVRGASNFVQLSLDQLTKTDGEHLTRAKAFCDVMGAEYFRFSPVFDKDIDLSEAKIQVLIDMLYQTYLYTLQETTKIDSLARLLLSKNN
jgi:calcium-independent phospholipase A2